MGEAKNRGTQEQRIAAAQVRELKRRLKWESFVAEVAKLSEQLGVEVAPVRSLHSDGTPMRFVVCKIDELKTLAERMTEKTSEESNG